MSIVEGAVMYFGVLAVCHAVLVAGVLTWRVRILTTVPKPDPLTNLVTANVEILTSVVSINFRYIPRFKLTRCPTSHHSPTVL
jgi:hypothetical protein